MVSYVSSDVTESKELLPGVILHPQSVITAKGTVEFDIAGDGPVVLAMHGGIGGCDQARIMANWIDPQQYRIVSPSRPGYLGTPLETGQTIEQQADAMIALMDILDVERAVILGASAGGPPAYMAAIRHPNRVVGLIVIDGVSGFYDMPETAGPITQAIFLSDLGQMLLQTIGDWAPRVVLQSLFQSEALFTKDQIRRHIEHVLADEQLLAFVRAFTAAMSPYRLRKLGTENDIAQYRGLTHLPVQKIRCPSLIIHGTHDADVKFFDGVYAYEHIRGAERFWIEDASHLGFWISPNSKRAQDAARSFLDRHAR